MAKLRALNVELMKQLELQQTISYKAEENRPGTPRSKRLETEIGKGRNTQDLANQFLMD